MNILYGNNRGKKKLYESFLDDVNEKIVDDLPEDLPPDDAEDISEGYWLKEDIDPRTEEEIHQIYQDMNEVTRNQKDIARAVSNINDFINDYRKRKYSKYESVNPDDETKLNECGEYEPIAEDTIKQDGKWVNKGKEGTHGEFKTKKEADAQRKAMFARGYKEGINEGATKDPTGLGAELEEIEDLYNEFGPEGFYKVKFSNFLKEFPLFGNEVILAFIKEMEIRSPEEMKDEETLEADWATGELIIKEDWPCILDGAHRMVNGRGKNNKHNVQWEKIWKNYYKSYDESFNK
jgi:hypothetical protein